MWIINPLLKIVPNKISIKRDYTKIIGGEGEEKGEGCVFLSFCWKEGSLTFLGKQRSSIFVLSFLFYFRHLLQDQSRFMVKEKKNIEKVTKDGFGHNRQ